MQKTCNSSQLRNWWNPAESPVIQLTNKELTLVLVLSQINNLMVNLTSYSDIFEVSPK